MTCFLSSKIGINQEHVKSMDYHFNVVGKVEFSMILRAMPSVVFTSIRVAHGGKVEGGKQSKEQSNAVAKSKVVTTTFILHRTARRIKRSAFEFWAKGLVRKVATVYPTR